MMSPSGDSILITSAPRSARICVASGPSTTVVRSRILISASGPGFVSLVSRRVRRGGFSFNMLTTGAFLRDRGGKNARDDVSQPALQHLAPDFGSAAREGDRAGHHRIFEDALFRGAKRAALVIFGDWIGGLAGFGREDRYGIGLGIVLRAITQSLGVRVVVPGALVPGHAIDDFVADVGMLEPDANELSVIPRADPDRQPAFVDRLLAEIADTRAQHPDPEFLGIEAGERFAKGLADAIAAVRPWHDTVIDLLRTGIKADSMVAGGEHDALHASAPRRLEHIVETDDVPFEDRRPFVLA